MPRPDPPGATSAGARLQALGLSPAAWVPDQPSDVVDHPVNVAAHPSGAATRHSDVGAPPVQGHAASPTARLPPAVVERLPLWVHDLRLSPSAAALGGLALACAACIGITAAVVVHHRAAPLSSVPPPVPAALAAPTPPGIVVDVGGRVRHPGLVTLPAGARVADAVREAGGALRAKDLATVNLAARLSDGQLLLIGVPGVGGGAGAGADGSAGGGPAAPVDLNTATLDQLEALPGVGPVLAQHILDWRQAHNGFRSVSDLQDVPGIGERKYADLHTLVVV